MSSIFSKIISGEIDSYKLYEDEKTFVFLTIRPHVKGHMLVVPKIEVDHWDEVPDPYFVAMWDTARKMAKLLKVKLNCKRAAVIIAGFEVPHAHIHVIPANTMKDIDPDMAYDASKEELTEMQEKLTS